METIDLKDVEIFSTGVWEGTGSKPGGDNITTDYLDSIVDSYNKIGDKVKPRMRLTHDGKRSEGITGVASIGWLKNIRRKGDKLITDILEVPKKIKDLIDVKAIGRFSPGVWRKMNYNGTDYNNVLDHLSLEGGTIVADMDLDGFITDMYEKNDDIINYTKKKDDSMEDDKKKIQELEDKIKEFEKKISDDKDDDSALMKENAELRAKVEKAEYDKREVTVNAKLDTAISDGKITPAQKDSFKSLMMGETIEDKGGVDFEKREDIIDKIIADSPVNKEFAKGDSSSSKKPDLEFDKKDDGSDLDKKATEYAKENNVTYKEALMEVGKEDNDG